MAKVNLGRISLDSEEKRILSYLGGNYKESVGLGDIVEYLKDVGYEGVTRRNVLDKLDRLSDVGYVRSKTKGKGEHRDEKFYLSGAPLAGKYARRGLQGRGVVHDTSKLIRRLFGSVFLFFGLGAVVYQGLNVTGAAVSSGSGGSLSFVFAFALIVVGTFLLKKK